MADGTRSLILIQRFLERLAVFKKEFRCQDNVNNFFFLSYNSNGYGDKMWMRFTHLQSKVTINPVVIYCLADRVHAMYEILLIWCRKDKHMSLIGKRERVS